MYYYHYTCIGAREHNYYYALVAVLDAIFRVSSPSYKARRIHSAPSATTGRIYTYTGCSGSSSAFEVR